MPEPSFCTLPDGAKLAYEVLGPEHFRSSSRRPCILVGGMSSRRGDWELLSAELAHQRTVLIYDHRGIGDSTFASKDRNDTITIEGLARDLMHLVRRLGWKDVDICGFSMGGIILQQLLFLPNLPPPSSATPLGFTVSHAILSGTSASPAKPGQSILPIPKDAGTRVLSEQEKKEIGKRMMVAGFDETWVNDEKKKERLEWWVSRSTNGRPLRTILKQQAALTAFNFNNLHQTIPKSTAVLIIHGELDGIVPFAAGRDLKRRIPWAKTLTVGSDPSKGEVPSFQFAHMWWEYFDVGVWTGVVEGFLDEPTGESSVKSRL